ncbi:MAG TPA: hypothetical protein PLX73_00430 [Candidatus Paceibacterota bacterium]|nr:hypothetical protein [Candidatus Paceibacterota bacterium]HOL53751.1 hypothetical protein [Candidatus Paceibacterota bacterium]HON22022.1 hypothetical protein [Candidatus Paceibacterota bacterium]HPP16849.1 hypothetical protein [Candidatus Paceibacterota bacterium]
MPRKKSTQKDKEIVPEEKNKKTEEVTDFSNKEKNPVEEFTRPDMKKANESQPAITAEKEQSGEFDSEDVNQNKYVAVFSYLSILVLIPLLLKRDSAFCQKHAKQGLVWLAFLILTSFCYFIPFFNILYALMVIGITLTCFIKTLQGKYWPIPLISQWAEKINL